MTTKVFYQELNNILGDEVEACKLLNSGLAGAIWYWDLENPEIEWVNEYFWKILGFESSETADRPLVWMQLANQRDLNNISKYLNRNSQCPNYTFNEDIRFSHKTGKIVWMSCTGRVVFNDNGEAVKILGSAIEITKKRIHEKSIGLEKELLSSSLNALKVGYWEVNIADSTVFWSSLMYSIHGVDDDFPLTFENCLSFYSEDDQIRISETMQHLLENPELPINLKARLFAAKGKQLNVLISFNSIPDVAGKPNAVRLLGTLQVLNTQDSVEASIDSELEKLKRKLFVNNEAMGMGFLRFNKSLSYIKACEFLCQLLDIPEEKNTSIHLKRKLKVIFNVEPSLFFSFVINVTKKIGLESAQSLLLGDFLLQFARKGIRRWFKIHLNVEHDSLGEPVFSLLLYNYDEQKKLEVEKVEQKYFLELSQRVSGVGHFMANLEKGTWSGSAVMMYLLGIDGRFEQTIRNWMSLLTPRSRKSVLFSIYKALVDKSAFDVKFQIVRPKDNETRWIELKAHFIQKEDIFKIQTEPMLVGTIQDVTEQMEYIERIEEQNAFLRKIAWSQSHEVRAPLSRLLGITKALDEMEPDDPDTKTLHRSLLPAAQEMDNVIVRLNQQINDFEELSGTPIRSKFQI